MKKYNMFIDLMGEIQVTSNFLAMLEKGTLETFGGIVKYILVLIGTFVFLIDVVVMEISDVEEGPLILRRSFFATFRALVDVEQGDVILITYSGYLSYKGNSS